MSPSKLFNLSRWSTACLLGAVLTAASGCGQPVDLHEPVTQVQQSELDSQVQMLKQQKIIN